MIAETLPVADVARWPARSRGPGRCTARCRSQAARCGGRAPSAPAPYAGPARAAWPAAGNRLAGGGPAASVGSPPPTSTIDRAPAPVTTVVREPGGGPEHLQRRDRRRQLGGRRRREAGARVARVQHLAGCEVGDEDAEAAGRTPDELMTGVIAAATPAAVARAGPGAVPAAAPSTGARPPPAGWPRCRAAARAPAGAAAACVTVTPAAIVKTHSTAIAAGARRLRRRNDRFPSQDAVAPR